MNRSMIPHAATLSVLFLACLAVIGVPSLGTAANPRYPAGFEPGTRVVLLADAPTVGEGLAAGMAGTILCCDADDCTGSLLVSWDLWRGGKDEENRCATVAVGPYPAGSATWVDPAQVLLGRPFDREGILWEIEGGCLYLETEKGELFSLGIGPEFRTQWPFVRAGNRVRVRGLLNTDTPDPQDKSTCPQRDGKVYHPILTASDWTGESCCDPFVCGFTYGDSVVLTGESDPNGALNLPRGASGTVICCNSRAENSVLVSWNLWSNGGSDDAYLMCNERLAGLFPRASTWWVPLESLAKYVRTECGTLQDVRLCSMGQCEDPNGVGLFVNGRGLYYLPDLPAQGLVTNEQFMVSGLFAPYATLPEGVTVATSAGVHKALAAIILHAVVLPCPKPLCCEAAYLPGDRVALLVDEPGGADGLLKEATGTVVCCNSKDANTPVLVSWDFWDKGHDEHEKCDCCGRPSYYPETSGWWVACSEIERIILPDLYDLGEDFQGFVPASVVAGQPDQMLTVVGAIANRGGAQSGVFFVELYASVDDQISSEDYFLGIVGMDIDAGGWADLSWTGKFPTDIPAGSYNIGWLIDPDEFVEEAKENNNIAVIEAGKLNVVSP